jgi:hypothetical protein
MLATSRTAVDARQPKSQIKAGQGSETIAAETDGVRNAGESADPIGQEWCCCGGASTVVIGAGMFDCNDHGMNRLHNGRSMIAPNAAAHTR